jgi:hypothetical protein
VIKGLQVIGILAGIASAAVAVMSYLSPGKHGGAQRNTASPASSSAPANAARNSSSPAPSGPAAGSGDRGHQSGPGSNAAGGNPPNQKK